MKEKRTMFQLLAKPVVAATQELLKKRVSVFTEKRGRAPGLAVVLVGTDPASVIYTTKKGQAALDIGMQHKTLSFPATVSSAEVYDAVQKLNEDPSVDGILIQRPVPSNFDSGFNSEALLHWVVPEKDVDSFHPINVGKLSLNLPGLRPCTPLGVMRLLEYYKIPVAGKKACVVGRSSIVGKPMATLLLNSDATVLHCHSKTKNLEDITRQAEILVVAAGKPALIQPEHVAPGTVVIDVGIHRNAQGKLCGDVHPDVAQIASAMTPVPGGVGPMTIAMLLSNTVDAAEASPH